MTTASHFSMFAIVHIYFSTREVTFIYIRFFVLEGAAWRHNVFCAIFAIIGKYNARKTRNTRTKEQEGDI